MRETTTWNWWNYGSTCGVLELHERATPDGCALEFEVMFGSCDEPSFGIWRLSRTGRVLALIEAGQA